MFLVGTSACTAQRHSFTVIPDFVSSIGNESVCIL